MVKQKDIYDRRYLDGYRDSLSGYEFARWKALEHLIDRTLKLGNARRVLDYGSGAGLHVDLWKKVFPRAELYFCDISPVALDKLTGRYPEFKLKAAEVNEGAAPFDNALFDVVVSVEVMEHVENLKSYLADIHRLLKPGGSFVWTTPCANPCSVEYVFSKLTGQIENTDEGYIRWKWEDQTHLRRLKSDEIKSMLQGIGFGSIEFRFRAHFFSFVCSHLFPDRLQGVGKRIMLLDYVLFRRLPNGASMIGVARMETR